MTDRMEITTLTTEQAETLTGESKARTLRARVYELEYRLIRARDELRVIGNGLEDVSALYGAVSLIEHVAGECDHVFWEGAEQ